MGVGRLPPRGPCCCSLDETKRKRKTSFWNSLAASRSRTSLAVLLCPVPAALVGAATANANHPCLRLRCVRTAQYTANTQTVLIRRPWFTFTVASSHHQPHAHALAGRFQRADTPRQNRTCRWRKYRTRVPAPTLAPPVTCLRGPRWRTRVRRSPSGSRRPRRTHPAPNYYRRQHLNRLRVASVVLCFPRGGRPDRDRDRRPQRQGALARRHVWCRRGAWGPAIENISWVGAAQLFDVGHALMSKREAPAHA